MITMMLYEHTDGDDDDADADDAHGQVDEAEVVSINSWLFLFRG